MSKLKNVSSFKKRFRKTARGKFVHSPCGSSHNNAHKSKSRKRRLHSAVTVSKVANRRVSTVLPYA